MNRDIRWWMSYLCNFTQSMIRIMIRVKNSYHQRDFVTFFRVWNNDSRKYTTKHYSNWIC